MIDFNYNVWTYLRSDVNIVTMRVRWNKKKYTVYLSLAYSWPKEKWDNEKQQAKNNTTNKINNEIVYAREVNAYKLHCLECIEKTFKEFKKQDIIPSPSDFKERVNEVIGNVDRLPEMTASNYTDTHEVFKTIYEEYMRERAIEKNWSKSTRDKNAQMWKCLCEYCSNITLGKLNRSTLNGLKKWYFDHGYHNTTVAKRFRDLKTFLRWVNDKGYTVNEEALKFVSNVPKSKKVITYLTFDELMHFAEFPLKQQYLQKARDIFCFMCYTSLRYKDVKELKKNNISNGFINLFAHKTKTKLSIPIIQYSQALIDRYMKTDGDYLFDVPTNQKLNKFLKTAAKEAGLNRKVEEMYYVGNERHETFKPLHEIIVCHMGRRTFVTCSLAFEIPPEVVMECTGHSTYEAMKPYIAIASSTKKKQMEKWNVNTTKQIVLKKIEQLSPLQLDRLSAYIDRLIKRSGTGKL